MRNAQARLSPPTETLLAGKRADAAVNNEVAGENADNETLNDSYDDDSLGAHGRGYIRDGAKIRWDIENLPPGRSAEHMSELQSLMRTSYAVFCLKKKTTTYYPKTHSYHLPILCFLAEQQ